MGLISRLAESLKNGRVNDGKNEKRDDIETVPPVTVSDTAGKKSYEQINLDDIDLEDAKKIPDTSNNLEITVRGETKFYEFNAGSKNLRGLVIEKTKEVDGHLVRTELYELAAKAEGKSSKGLASGMTVREAREIMLRDTGVPFTAGRAEELVAKLLDASPQAPAAELDKSGMHRVNEFIKAAPAPATPAEPSGIGTAAEAQAPKVEPAAGKAK